MNLFGKYTCIVFVLALSFTLLVSSSALFSDDCTFGFGTSYNEGIKSITNNKFTHISAWIGHDDVIYSQGSWIQGAALYAKKWNIPLVVYGYIIAKNAKRFNGVDDCDVNPHWSLCVEGSNFLRNTTEWNKVIADYEAYANGIKGDIGTNHPSVWLIEPDFIQYSVIGDPNGKQNGGAVPDAEMAVKYFQIVNAIKKYLPNARIGLDISPWMNEKLQTWYNNFDGSKIDLLFTSGGRTQGDNERIRADYYNNITWAQAASYFGGKPVLADDGYGVGGHSDPSIQDWLNMSNVENRVRDGVIGVTIAHDNKQIYESLISNLVGPACAIPGTNLTTPEPTDPEPNPTNPGSDKISPSLFGCTFGFGMSYRAHLEEIAERDGNHFSHVSVWAGYQEAKATIPFNRYHEGLAAKYAFKHKIPLVVYSYVIAYYARQTFDLADCDVPSEKTLCTHGSEVIRKKWDVILARYDSIAKTFADEYNGRDMTMVFLIEPDIQQYSEIGDELRKQFGGPITDKDMAGKYFNDIVATIKKHLPNAKIGVDISPWHNERQPGWYALFDKSKVDLVFTSGGRTIASTERIRGGYNQVTYKGSSDLFGGIPVLADVGYGTQGVVTKDYDQWLDMVNVNNRVKDNVIGVTISIRENSELETVSATVAKNNKETCKNIQDNEGGNNGGGNNEGGNNGGGNNEGGNNGGGDGGNNGGDGEDSGNASNNTSVLAAILFSLGAFLFAY